MAKPEQIMADIEKRLRPVLDKLATAFPGYTFYITPLDPEIQEGDFFDAGIICKSPSGVRRKMKRAEWMEFLGGRQ